MAATVAVTSCAAYRRAALAVVQLPEASLPRCNAGVLRLNSSSQSHCRAHQQVIPAIRTVRAAAPYLPVGRRRACRPQLGGAPSVKSRAPFSTSSRRARQVDFLLADVGEGITECEIVEWYVQPGSQVEEFDMLVLLQTDKATVEVTSRYKGKVTEHCYKVGEVARVGTPLCRIEVEGADAETEQTEDSQASGAGAESEQHHEQPECVVSHSAQTEADPQPQAATGSSSHDLPSDHAHRSLATPAVRRISRENDVDINRIQGTGKEGRVTKDDVQQYINNRQNSASLGAASSSGSKSRSSSASAEETTTYALSGTRKAMFRAMTSTWQAPHFLYTDEIDVTQLTALRAALQAKRSAKAQNDEPKLTLLPFLIKAMSLVLDDHPLFRSLLDAERMELRQTNAHRFSVALASARGLVTPTLPGDVRHQSILDIARNVALLQQRGASERGLSASDMGTAGSTITLSNIGSVGGTYTFPLLPPTGQLVIGGLGRARVLPRFDASGDNIVKATILTASFAADHRVVEGIELARFVDDWKRRVEDPASWMLEMR